MSSWQSIKEQTTDYSTIEGKFTESTEQDEGLCWQTHNRNEFWDRWLGIPAPSTLPSEISGPAQKSEACSPILWSLSDHSESGINSLQVWFTPRIKNTPSISCDMFKEEIRATGPTFPYFVAGWSEWGVETRTWSHLGAPDAEDWNLANNWGVGPVVWSTERRQHLGTSVQVARHLPTPCGQGVLKEGHLLCAYQTLPLAARSLLRFEKINEGL